MTANDAAPEEFSGNELVSISDWDACYDSESEIIALSCTVTTNDSSATISSAGLILSTDAGMTLCSTYTEFSGESQSASPAINLPPGGLRVGDTIWGTVSGEVDGQHYFFEEHLTIGTC